MKKKKGEINMFWLGLFLGNIMGIIAILLCCMSLGKRYLKNPNATVWEIVNTEFDEILEELEKDDENKKIELIQIWGW